MTIARSIPTGCLLALMVFFLCSPTTSAARGPSKKECIASWYGADGEIPPGWPTASGEPFNRDAMATAALLWDFGTKLKVTNKANGKSVVVRVNDRGPYTAGRCVDLTRAAFKKIGNLDTGVLNVRVERV